MLHVRTPHKNYVPLFLTNSVVALFIIFGAIKKWKMFYFIKKVKMARRSQNFGLWLFKIIVQVKTSGKAIESL